MSGAEDFDLIVAAIRKVVREEIAAAKVDRYGAVDELIARLSHGDCARVSVEFLVPTEGVGDWGKKITYQPGDIEIMQRFVDRLRAALQAERSAR